MRTRGKCALVRRERGVDLRRQHDGALFWQLGARHDDILPSQTCRRRPFGRARLQVDEDDEPVQLRLQRARVGVRVRVRVRVRVMVRVRVRVLSSELMTNIFLR